MSRALFALLLLVAACGGHATESTLPKGSPPIPTDPLPEHGSASADGGEPSPNTKGPGLAAKDPRIVDLDIIRISGNVRGVGGDGEPTAVATVDLFKQANEAAKAGRTQEAISRYRALIDQFPESLYAPVAMFDIAAIYDGQGDMTSTITTLRELVTKYPNSRESVDGHLYIAALQADHQLWADANATLAVILARGGLTEADRVEANARMGYVLMEQHEYDQADAALDEAFAAWRRASRIDDVYYIAMAHYYRGEVLHRRFTESPVRLPDSQLLADLDTKRGLASAAYDRWKVSLQFKHAYWATASGYQMSQIFVELWEATVKAPLPTQLTGSTRDAYLTELHAKMHDHLVKALEGHEQNVELAKAFGVETTWSRGSAARAAQILELLNIEAKRK